MSKKVVFMLSELEDSKTLAMGQLHFLAPKIYSNFNLGNKILKH